MTHAVVTTRRKTLHEAIDCNIRLSRARDFLAHSPPHEIVTPDLAVTAEEFDELREASLAALRALCATCGLCATFGLYAP